jgi:hypothetical protein
MFVPPLAGDRPGNDPFSVELTSAQRAQAVDGFGAQVGRGQFEIRFGIAKGVDACANVAASLLQGSDTS